MGWGGVGGDGVISNMLDLNEIEWGGVGRVGHFFCRSYYFETTRSPPQKRQ